MSHGQHLSVNTICQLLVAEDPVTDLHKHMMAKFMKVGKIEVLLWRCSDLGPSSDVIVYRTQPDDVRFSSKVPEKVLKGRTLSHHLRFVSDGD